MKERIKSDLNDIFRNFRHGGITLVLIAFLLGLAIGAVL